jgi:feruloyl-CoA synthase
MSAKPNIVRSDTMRAASTPSAARDLVRRSRRHIERRDDGTIYLRPKRRSATIRSHHRPPASLGRGRAEPRLHGGARRRRRLAADHLRAIAGLEPAHRLGAARRAGCRPKRPVVILSGNSIDHALIAFGALYAGIPFCPVSPAYSLVSKDYGKLGYLMKLLTPGLVFADDADKFADALAANVPPAPRSPRRAARCPAAT